jgi:predicted ATPase
LIRATKFGVAGTHSTGKSTLVEELSNSLRSQGLRVAKVSDTASQAQDLGFPILRKHTFTSTLWIMSHGISKELEAELNADVVLVDRPVPDALGYLWAALASRKETLTQADHEYLVNLARHHTRTYDMICRTALDTAIPLGPERDRDPDFRSEADKQIMAVFKELGVEPRMVKAGEAVVEELTSEIKNIHTRRRG